MKSARRAIAAALFLASVMAPTTAHASPPSDGENGNIRAMTVEGTRIKVKKDDGSWATNEELVGAVLVAYNDQGVKERYRIESIEEFESENAGTLLLYVLTIQDPSSKQWVQFCKPDRQGRVLAFPMSGYWDEQGNHIRSEDEFSLTCTGGTIGKCVFMGYVPWRATPDGPDMWALHQACVRLYRADYCGNGNPHTRDGTLIEVWDREGIQVDTSVPNLAFEAGWNEEGAVCIRRTRIPELATIADIERECPEKLVGRTGPDQCPESFDDPAVLILNRSPPPKTGPDGSPAAPSEP